MSEQMMLRLERRDQVDESRRAEAGNVVVDLGPAVGEDYWTYRVGLGESQALLGFPKHGTIGIGFAVEEDWNTNLPYRADTDAIVNHIWHNRGPDERITKEVVRAAVVLVQAAACEDRGETGR